MSTTEGDYLTPPPENSPLNPQPVEPSALNQIPAAPPQPIQATPQTQLPVAPPVSQAPIASPKKPKRIGLISLTLLLAVSLIVSLGWVATKFFTSSTDSIPDDGFPIPANEWANGYQKLWSTEVHDIGFLPIAMTENHLILGSFGPGNSGVKSYSYNQHGDLQLAWTYDGEEVHRAFASGSRLFLVSDPFGTAQLVVLDLETGTELPTTEFLSSSNTGFQEFFITRDRLYICNEKEGNSHREVLGLHPKFLNGAMFTRFDSCEAYSDNDQLIWRTDFPKNETSFVLNWDTGVYVEESSPEYDSTIRELYDAKVNFTIVSSERNLLPFEALNQYNASAISTNIAGPKSLLSAEKLLGKKLDHISFNDTDQFTVQNADGTSTILPAGKIKAFVRTDSNNSKVSVWIPADHVIDVPYLIASFHFGPSIPDFITNLNRDQSGNEGPFYFLMNPKLILKLSGDRSFVQLTAYAPKE